MMRSLIIFCIQIIVSQHVYKTLVAICIVVAANVCIISVRLAASRPPFLCRSAACQMKFLLGWLPAAFTNWRPSGRITVGGLQLQSHAICLWLAAALAFLKINSSTAYIVKKLYYCILSYFEKNRLSRRHDKQRKKLFSTKNY